MKKPSLLFFIFTAMVFFSCNTNKEDYCRNGTAMIIADSLRKNTATLASDSFQGRKPFTEGEKKTIQYLGEQFIRTGLEPGNGDSYLQEVPMANILAIASPTMVVESSKGMFSLKSYDDYIIWTDRTDEFISLDRNELVFAGYGVVAPEYGWNDYQGLDVKGKVVMVMVNDPGFWSGDTSLFKGKTMTYYGRWTYKFEEAARQGAKGCLIIHNTAAASYPFIVQQNSFNNSRLILDNRNRETKNCDVIGWIPEAVAKRLFKEAGYDSTLLLQANKPGFKAMSLNLKLSATLKVKVSYDKSFNVIGKITGSKYPDEVIVYTAHWDHLGIGKPDDKGDTIYNGALDNATAVAGLIELARAFKCMKVPPERTIVFLAVTAEEEGLLGWQYYVENPVFPLNKTVACINMECLNWHEKTKDMIIIGKGQSELEDYYIAEVLHDSGYISPETHPEAGSYFRSDHFNFAKAGIPALYAGTGIDVEGKGKEYGKSVEDDYYRMNYHRPSDEFSDSLWTMEGAVHELDLLFRVGKRLAMQEQWPQWKSDADYKRVKNE